MAREMVCVRCGTVGKPKQKVKGSFLLEAALWLMLIIPGIFYSLWRSFGGTLKVCRSCGSEELVPTDSPRGRELLAARASRTP